MFPVHPFRRISFPSLFDCFSKFNLIQIGICNTIANNPVFLYKYLLSSVSAIINKLIFGGFVRLNSVLNGSDYLQMYFRSKNGQA